MAGNGILVLTDPPRIISIGTQGPQGPPGSGTVIVQETEPTSPVAGDFWLVESTGVLSARTGGVWEQVVYSSQLASDTETLDINAGYF